MTKLDSLHQLEITVSDARTRDDELTRAVNQLIPTALELRRGILVTRNNPVSYTCEVHPMVPCGTVQEASCE